MLPPSVESTYPLLSLAIAIQTAFRLAHNGQRQRQSAWLWSLYVLPCESNGRRFPCRLRLSQTNTNWLLQFEALQIEGARFALDGRNKAVVINFYQPARCQKMVDCFVNFSFINAVLEHALKNNFKGCYRLSLLNFSIDNHHHQLASNRKKRIIYVIVWKKFNECFSTMRFTFLDSLLFASLRQSSKRVVFVLHKAFKDGHLMLILVGSIRSNSAFKIVKSKFTLFQKQPLALKIVT